LHLLQSIALIAGRRSFDGSRQGDANMDNDHERRHRPERSADRAASNPLSEPSECIDVNGPWWKGFFQGWRDHDEGREPSHDGEVPCLWSEGYDAGWIAYCCEARPHPSDRVASALGGHPAWN
jgi:hypothetical protein